MKIGVPTIDNQCFTAIGTGTNEMKKSSHSMEVKMRIPFFTLDWKDEGDSLRKKNCFRIGSYLLS